MNWSNPVRFGFDTALGEAPEARRRRGALATRFVLAIALGAALVSASGSAEASRLWRWQCHGTGIDAQGTLTTGDMPNADGFYEIMAVAGRANGTVISGLEPTGLAIPGNEGYPVDNLIRPEGRQLTKSGFAFSLANGTYANPFYGSHFHIPPGYYAFLSDPKARKTSEPNVTFQATLVP